MGSKKQLPFLLLEPLKGGDTPRTGEHSGIHDAPTAVGKGLDEGCGQSDIPDELCDVDAEGVEGRAASLELDGLGVCAEGVAGGSAVAARELEGGDAALGEGVSEPEGESETVARRQVGVVGADGVLGGMPEGGGARRVEMGELVALDVEGDVDARFGGEDVVD